MFLKLQTKNNIYKKTSNIGTPTNQLNVPSIHPSIQTFILIRKDDRPASNNHNNVHINWVQIQRFFFQNFKHVPNENIYFIFFSISFCTVNSCFELNTHPKLRRNWSSSNVYTIKRFKTIRRTLFTLTHQDIFNDRTFV